VRVALSECKHASVITIHNHTFFCALSPL